MTHDEMIVQSEAGKLAKKFLDENYPEDAGDWLVIELAHYFLDFVEMKLQKQREACEDKAFQYMDEHTGATWEVFIAGVQQAILNAVEKEDEL